MPPFKTLIPCTLGPEIAHAQGMDSANRLKERVREEWPLYMQELAATLVGMPAERAAPTGLDMDKYNYMMPSKMEPMYVAAKTILKLPAAGYKFPPPGYPMHAGPFKGVWLCTFESKEVCTEFCTYAAMDIGLEHSMVWMRAEYGAPDPLAS